jgi:biotin transporter BioY
VIYLAGLGWLYTGFLHNVQATLAGGLLPFIPGEVAKFALAAAVITATQRAAARRRG